jgi:nucleotide-binding universal stress UspA family protein
MRERGKAYNDAMIQRLAAVGDISLSAAYLEGPVVESTINRHAADSGADLMVMTTQGRAPMARFWLGSVADALLRQASIPILYVRPQDGEPDLNQVPSLKRMLIPLDGSELAEQILEPAVALAAATQAEITLIRVVQQLTPAGYDPDSGRISGIRPALLQQLREIDRKEWTSAEVYLNQIAGRLGSPSLTVKTRTISHIRPAIAIIDDAESHSADLIAQQTKPDQPAETHQLSAADEETIRQIMKDQETNRAVGYRSLLPTLHAAPP